MALISDRISGKQQIIGSQFIGTPSVGARFNEIDNLGKAVEDWVWNGYYWLSSNRFTSFSLVNLASSSNLILPVNKDHNLFVDKIVIDYTISGTNSTTKYWSFALFQITNAYGWIWLGGNDTQSNWYGEQIISVNSHDNISITNSMYYLLQITRNSNPGNLAIAGNFIYKSAKQ